MGNPSIEFLQWLRPTGPWVLTAIIPDGAIYTRTFKAEHERGLGNWLKQHAKKNIYFQVNSSGNVVLEKKATKDHIKLGEYLHVDVDPNPEMGFDESRDSILSTLLGYKIQPSCIIDSGGGYQAFWRLAVPIEDLNLVERCNLQLARDLGGDHCHNIDRIMRLPGTTNWPNRKKKALGRESREAELVFQADTDYDIAEFVAAPKVEGEAEPILDLEEPVSLEELPLTDELRALIVIGKAPGREYSSRSEAAWFVMCEMVRRQINPAAILQICLNKEYAISAHFYDQTNPKGSVLRQITRAQDNAVSPELMEMNEEYFTTFVGGRIRVVRERKDEDLEFLDPGSFEKFFSNQQIKVGENRDGAPVYKKKGKWWMEHPQRRSYRGGLIFEPEQEEKDDQYNSWAGFSVQPEEGSLHERYLEHIHEQICERSETVYQYVIAWMARVIQSPASQSETALVLKGKEGTGKNSFVLGLSQILKRHFFETPNANHFVGNFNYHLRDKVLVHANEAFYAGDRKHEAALKMLITEPTLPIERKGVDVQQAPNYVHLIMSSNSEWVVPAGPDSRRFLVLEVSENKKGDSEYFRLMKKDLYAGGFANLLHYLWTLDISSYQVRSVPNTKALAHQRIQSMGDIEQWWMYCLARGHVTTANTDWEEEIVVDEAWIDFREENKNSRITRQNFSRVMTKMVPKIKRERRQIEHSKRYFYILPSLEECRDLFDRVMGGPYDWDNMA